MVKYKLGRYSNALLGKGAHSIVFKATEEGSGRSVALKKSRVSKTVKRPILRHEARVLQMIGLHPDLPCIYGYGQLDHFEYLAIELLGPSVANKLTDGAGVMPKTVIRFVELALQILAYVHAHGIVHRDIKPENFLCPLHNSTTIKLVDFAISKPYSHHNSPPSKYDPLKDRRHIVGSLYWASLNSHNGEGSYASYLSVNFNQPCGLDLSPRDDIESLAYVVLFLLRGNLPWKPRPYSESQLRSQEIVRVMKAACSGPALSANFPSEFGELLTYSRSLSYGQWVGHGRLETRFQELARRMGCSFNTILDWTPCYPQVTNPILEEPTVSIPGEDEDEDGGDEGELGDDSYFGWDTEIWDRQGERSRELTLPAEQNTESWFYSTIPLIEEVKARQLVPAS